MVSIDDEIRIISYQKEAALVVDPISELISQINNAMKEEIEKKIKVEMEKGREKQLLVYKNCIKIYF